MIGLFLNPGFLLVAAALVSVPIIIHLINRMRFKRLRWAAMEFLLKAQKRTRRRLIIEQLLLLALRCCLVGLFGLLVLHFVGCGDTSVGGKPNMIVALLDDTPSMQDQWTQDGVKKNCFDVAKDILTKKIAKGLSQSKTNDRLLIIPLSKIKDPDFKPFDHLDTPEKLAEVNRYITELQPSMVHVSMLEGVKRAQKEMDQYPESQITLHVLSDFRQSDWGASKAEALIKEVNSMAQVQKGIKIRLIDTVYPIRSAAQGGDQKSRPNVGIVDFRPSTRIIGTNMPVQFTVSIKNFSGSQADFHIEARNENLGKDMLDVNFNPQNPIKLLPGQTGTVTFEQRFIPDKANEAYFANVSVRLVDASKHELGSDGLLADNIRYTVVEVRDKVPILVVDGEGPKGRDENKDSFFIHRSLASVPGASYQVVFGDELSPGNPTSPTKALERADLNKFPTIFLLNVRDLTPKQTLNLENYVKEGGGVAFYLGEHVNAQWYNKNLYKEGKGIFPAPLRDDFYPARNDKELEPKGRDTYQLIIREDKFSEASKTPIFGQMFLDPGHKQPLRDLPIRRYWKIAEGQWKPAPGRVQELATLPNDALAEKFNAEVGAITRAPAVNVKAIRENQDLAKFHAAMNTHILNIEKKVQPGSEAKAYHLAAAIEAMFNDKGGPARASMTEFWANSDPNVQGLRSELTSLRDRVNYGDPFILTQNFGRGKAVVILSTAGKDWNDWGGGSMSQVLYPMFIWEMQNYLSSQGSEANLTCGQDIDLQIDAEQFRGARLKLVRTFKKTDKGDGAKATDVKIGEPEGRPDGGQIHFTMTKNNEPGVYISKLVDDSAPDKALAIFAHAFNVDTEREGNLQRVGDDLDRELVSAPGSVTTWVVPGMPDNALVGRANDFSESPWLFLIFLFVLVAEQALAVHLSFHNKGDEAGLAPAGAGSRGTV